MGNMSKRNTSDHPHPTWKKSQRRGDSNPAHPRHPVPDALGNVLNHKQRHDKRLLDLWQERQSAGKK